MRDSRTLTPPVFHCQIKTTRASLSWWAAVVDCCPLLVTVALALLPCECLLLLRLLYCEWMMKRGELTKKYTKSIVLYFFEQFRQIETLSWAYEVDIKHDNIQSGTTIDDESRRALPSHTALSWAELVVD